MAGFCRMLRSCVSSLSIAGASSHRGDALPHPVFLGSLSSWRQMHLNNICASFPSTRRFRPTPYHLLCGSCAGRHWRLFWSNLQIRPGNLDRGPLLFGVTPGWYGSTRLENKVAARTSCVPLPCRTRGVRSSRSILQHFSDRVWFRLSESIPNLPTIQVDAWPRLWQG